MARRGTYAAQGGCLGGGVGSSPHTDLGHGQNQRCESEEPHGSLGMLKEAQQPETREKGKRDKDKEKERHR